MKNSRDSYWIERMKYLLRKYDGLAVSEKPCPVFVLEQQRSELIDLAFERSPASYVYGIGGVVFNFEEIGRIEEAYFISKIALDDFTRILLIRGGKKLVRDRFFHRALLQVRLRTQARYDLPKRTMKDVFVDQNMELDLRQEILGNAILRRYRDTASEAVDAYISALMVKHSLQRGVSPKEAIQVLRT